MVEIPIALTKPVTFLVIILITWIVAELLKRLIARIFQFSLPQLSMKIQQLTYLTIWILGLLIAINQLGVRMDIFLLIMGFVGLIVVVALRDVLANLFARPFLEPFYTFKVGDVIKVGKHTGRVIEINLLNTVILSGEKGKNILVTIPNSTFLKQITVHKSPYTGLSVKIPIIVDTRLDINEVERKILRICRGFKEDINWKKPPILLPSRMMKNKKEILLFLNLTKLERKAHVIFKLNERIKEVVKNMEERLQGQ